MDKLEFTQSLTLLVFEDEPIANEALTSISHRQAVMDGIAEIVNRVFEIGLSRKAKD